jgi:hypothetical protein
MDPDEHAQETPEEQKHREDQEEHDGELVDEQAANEEARDQAQAEQGQPEDSLEDDDWGDVTYTYTIVQLITGLLLSHRTASPPATTEHGFLRSLAAQPGGGYRCHRHQDVQSLSFFHPSQPGPPVVADLEVRVC